MNAQLQGTAHTRKEQAGNINLGSDLDTLLLADSILEMVKGTASIDNSLTEKQLIDMHACITFVQEILPFEGAYRQLSTSKN